MYRTLQVPRKYANKIATLGMRVKRMESGIGLPNEAKLLHFRKRKWQNVKNITRSIPPKLWALE